MAFDAAEAYLVGLGVDAMKSMSPSMHRIQALCEAMNNPQQAAPAIHVTGTNGKTSTAFIATSLLSATGLSVGTYTSPHLQSIRERIALSGEPISEDEFGDAFDHMVPYLNAVENDLGERLTFFEVLTGMFFLWAAESSVDALVVEVGLGGRWDATNVVDAAVAVITNVGLDHAGLLGADKQAIAGEKVGIIKPDAFVVTAERSPGVLSVIEERARATGAPLSCIGKTFEVIDSRVALGGRYLSLRTSSGDYEGLFLPLHGSHQGINAATALEAVTRFLPAQPLGHDLVAEGLGKTVVRGRLETLRPETESGPTVVLDVAHNPDGISALVGSLIETFAFESVRFVIGILGDKDYRAMLAELSRIPCSAIATQPQTVRSVPGPDLKVAAQEFGIQCQVVEDVKAAVDVAVDVAGREDLVCITGSHYVVGEARNALVP